MRPAGVGQHHQHVEGLGARQQLPGPLGAEGAGLEPAALDLGFLGQGLEGHGETPLEPLILQGKGLSSSLRLRWRQVQGADRAGCSIRCKNKEGVISGRGRSRTERNGHGPGPTRRPSLEPTSSLEEDTHGPAGQGAGSPPGRAPAGAGDDLQGPPQPPGAVHAGGADREAGGGAPGPARVRGDFSRGRYGRGGALAQRARPHGDAPGGHGRPAGGGGHGIALREHGSGHERRGCGGGRVPRLRPRPARDLALGRGPGAQRAPGPLEGDPPGRVPAGRGGRPRRPGHAGRRHDRHASPAPTSSWAST